MVCIANHLKRGQIIPCQYVTFLSLAGDELQDSGQTRNSPHPSNCFVICFSLTELFCTFSSSLHLNVKVKAVVKSEGHEAPLLGLMEGGVGGLLAGRASDDDGNTTREV